MTLQEIKTCPTRDERCINKSVVRLICEREAKALPVNEVRYAWGRLCVV